MPCQGALAVKLPATFTGTPSMLVTVMAVPLVVNKAQSPAEVPVIQVPSVCAEVSVACCEPTTRPMPRPPTRTSLRSIQHVLSGRAEADGRADVGRALHHLE